jgi:hypothetical protein
MNNNEKKTAQIVQIMSMISASLVWKTTCSKTINNTVINTFIPREKKCELLYCTPIFIYKYEEKYIYIVFIVEFPFITMI